MKPRKEDNEVSRSYQMTLGRKKTSRNMSRVLPNRQVRLTGATRHSPPAPGMPRSIEASLRQQQPSLTHRILFFFFSSPDMKKLHNG